MKRALVMAVAALLANASVQALEFRIHDLSSPALTSAQLDAIEAAAQVWEDTLIDPIEVVVNVELVPGSAMSNPNALASATPAKTTHHWFSAARPMMMIDADGPDEIASVGSLPTLTIPVDDVNGARNVDFVTMSTANAKALGLSTGRDPLYGPVMPFNADGEIRINADRLMDFDFDRSNGIGTGQFDFVGIMIHEFGHVLGFFSLTDTQEANPALALAPNTLDLWRFGQSLASHNLTAERRKVIAGGAEIEDIVHSERMSRGLSIVDPQCAASGNTCSASHFRDGTNHIMDPTSSVGVQRDPTESDIHTLDFIGYDRAATFSLGDLGEVVVEGIVPFEPSVWLTPSLPPSAGYPLPAPFAPARVPFAPNVGLVAQVEFPTLDSGEAMLGGRRTLFGYLQFAPREEISIEPVQPHMLSDRAGDVVQPPVAPEAVLPPRICALELRSDAEGPRFRSLDGIGPGCAPFDETLGAHGGFRLPLCVSSRGTEGTGLPPVCEARMTLNLNIDRAVEVQHLSAELLQNATFEVAGIWDVYDLLDPHDVIELDRDKDGVNDVDDNCPWHWNPGQEDADNDELGDVCDPIYDPF